MKTNKNKQISIIDFFSGNNLAFIVLILIYSCQQKTHEGKLTVHQILLDKERNEINKEIAEVKKENNVGNTNYIELVEYTKKNIDSMKKKGEISGVIDKLINYYSKYDIDISEIGQLKMKLNDNEILNNIDELEVHLLKKANRYWLEGQIVSNKHLYAAIKYDKDNYLFTYMPVLDSTNTIVQSQFLNRKTNKIEKLDSTKVIVRNNSGAYFIRNLTKKHQTVEITLKKKNGEFQFYQVEIPPAHDTQPTRSAGFAILRK